MEGANSALETPQFEMEMAKIEMDYTDADEDHFDLNTISFGFDNSDTFYRF